VWVEKNGPVWRVRDERGGKKITVATGFRTKTAARIAKTQLEADALRGDSLRPQGGQVLIAEWIDAWWPSYEATLKPSTRISADGLVRRYIRPMLGHLTMDDLDPLTVQRWTADLLAGRTESKRKLAVKTVRNAHGLLHKLMSDAVNHRLLRANPCTRTGLPERTYKEMRFLTEPEAARLLAAMPDHWRPLVLLLLGTGLRWGEAIGLRVQDVDVLARRLTVVQTMQELADTAEIVFVTPKSRRSRRTVTFPPSVADALIPLVANKDRGALVFTAVRGGPVRARRFRLVWKAAITSAGLEGLRIHDIRHTYAAWLISAGHPLTGVSRRMGHSSVSVTADIYGHLTTEVDDAILSTLDAALPMPELDPMIEIRGPVGGVVVDSIPIQSTPVDSSSRQESS
jgi:integrase